MTPVRLDDTFVSAPSQDEDGHMSGEYWLRAAKFCAAVSLGFTPELWRTGLCVNLSNLINPDYIIRLELIDYFIKHGLDVCYPVKGGQREYHRHRNKYGNHDYGLARRRLAKALSIHFWNKWREANETTVQQAV